MPKMSQLGRGNGVNSSPTSSSTGTSQARTLLDISRVPFHSLQTLSKILPMDSKERLRIEPKICVASTKKIGHPRCKKTTATSEILQPTPSRPTGSVMDPITSASLSLIRGLIDSSLCGNCHRRPSRAEFDRICDDLDTMCDADRAIFNKWIRAIIFGSVGENSPTVAPDPPQLIHSTLTITRRPAASVVFSTGHRPVTRSLTYLPAISSSTQHAQRFSLYRPISSTGTSASAAIWSLLMKPLSKQDLLEGQIYMYRTRGNLEYLKIGLTTRDVFQRLSEWVRQCGHETIPVHSWTIPVPHVYRVEKLVHG